MRTKIFLLLFVTLLLGCSSHASNQRTKNIEAFTHTYGLVRWFYPSDEVQQIDWDNLALYGVSQVANCKSSEELKSKLEELFLPIAPGISFSQSPQHDGVKSITPEQTSGMSLVTWQHYGVDLGVWSNTFVSKRSNRPLQTENVSQLAIDYSMTVADFVGKEITVNAEIRNNSNSEDFQIFFHANLTSNEGEDYVTFCVDNPEREPLNNSGEWQTYSRTLRINKEDENSLLRYGVYTKGDGDFSLGKTSVKVDGKSLTRGIHSNYGHSIVYDYSTKGGWWDISTKNKIFEEQAHWGEIATRRLDSELYVHVPLVLYATKEHTYPACNGDDFADFKSTIDSIAPSNSDLMLADIIVAWNVIKYFSPYLSDLKINWDKELAETLRDAVERTDYDSRPLMLMMAKINDAHVKINTFQTTEEMKQRRYLPIGVAVISGELVVTRSFDAQIEVGDVIEKVNDLDAVGTYRSFEEFISGSPHYKTLRAENLWLSSFGSQSAVNLSINRVGERKHLNLSPIIRDDYVSQLRLLLKNNKKSEWIDKTTLYLNLSNTSFSETLELLVGRRADQTVIVDVRNGTQVLFMYYLNHICDLKNAAPPRGGITQVPRVVRPETPLIIDTLSNIVHRVVDKKNIFLVGPLNYSHHEEMLDYIQYAGVGYLIGTNTGGCNGRVNLIPLPSGGDVTFTGIKVFSNLGKSSYYYSTGIKPDLYVEDTIEDIKLGRISALEEAIKVSANR